jgi:glycosyltransferase involved in cell wall biosynthesis
MRVLHVIARINKGGTARYLETLSLGLTAAGIENAIATGHVQNGEIEDEGVARLPILRVKHLGRAISPLNDFRASRELKKIVEEFNPDVIHTHTFKAGLIGRSLRFSGRRIHTYHGHVLSDGSLARWQVMLVKLSEQWLSRRTDVLVSVGEKVATELREWGIGRKSKWVSIAPGVEAPVLPSREVALRNLGLEGDRVRVGWLGRMVGVKNPHLALDIARAMPEIEFLIAGGGELLEEIRSAAPRNARILGWVNRENLLAASDVILMTSKSEGMPLSAIESLMAGKMVVGTNVGSLPEIILDSECGTINGRNARDLSIAIRQIIEDKPSMERMRSEGADRAIKLFSPRKMIERHQGIYIPLRNA